MSWYLATMKKYVDFNGRARRKEYWMFWLFNIIFLLIAAFLDNILGTTFGDDGFGIIYLVYGIAIMLPSIAVTVRRLHDIGKSGWWYFISVIPFIGGIWLFILLVSDSDSGDNEYGVNPKTNY